MAAAEAKAGAGTGVGVKAWVGDDAEFGAVIRTKVSGFNRNRS